MADIELTDITEDTAPSVDDIFYTVNDPAGTPGDRKVTFTNARKPLLSNGYLHYREEQAQNTAGGTFTSGAWRTRVLNTEVSDTGALGTLASNQITLAAGVYRIFVRAPAYAVGRNQLRLQNITDASTVLVGESSFAQDSAPITQVHAMLVGVFTVAAAKVLEIQHWCAVTRATDGFGLEANLSTEVFTTVELMRVG